MGSSTRLCLVNFGEDGAVEVARILLSKGVEAEAGLCDANATEIFLKSGLVDRCLRVLIEPQEQEMEDALRAVSEMESVLDSVPVKLPRLLHGTEATTWPMMKEAISRGYAVRIGLEDTLVMPDGRATRNNVDLLAEAVRQVQAAKHLQVTSE